MISKSSRHLALTAVATIVALAAGVAVSRADPPGYLFMDIADNHALVVQPPGEQTMARVSKQPTRLTDDFAAAIAADAEPVGANRIIIAYHGQLYILPDKGLGGGKMVSRMVTRNASPAGD